MEEKKLKTVAQISIDVDVKARHAVAGTNLSHVCNEFLKTYFEDENEGLTTKDNENEIQNLRAKIAQLSSKLVVQKEKDSKDNELKRKEQLTVAIVKLKALQRDVMAGSLLAKDAYKGLFDVTMENFGLTREELARKVF